MIITLNFALILVMAALVMNLRNAPYRQRSRWFLTLVGIQLFALYCFYDWAALPDLPQYAIGYDHVRTHGYEIIYGSGMRANEPGWIWLNILLSHICPNPRLLFMLAGGVIIYGHFRTYSRCSAMPWLSVYLFFCTMFVQSLFVIRQHMAIGICLLALPYIFQRKFMKFLLMVSVAGLIHSSAWIFLVAYWVYPLKMGQKFVILCLAAGVLSWLLMKTIMENFLAGNVYASYLDMEGANITPLLICLCTIVLTLVAVPLRKLQKQPQNRLFFCLCCVAACIAGGG